jgi:hypothetical protein
VNPTEIGWYLMPRQSWLVVALLAVLSTSLAGAHAHDASYPDWKGQWERIGGGQFDPSKRPGRGQQPPLTAEYQAVWEANLAEEAAGGQTYNPMASCIPTGMPRMMTAYQPMEIIITPDVTWISMAFLRELRRVYTDGRDWPTAMVPSYGGYSIGRWIDSGGDGRYSVLEIETRGMRGPRIFESSGIPLHRDGQTVVKERIFLDLADRNTLRDEITTIDHALTHPWTVLKSYRRILDPTWVEDVCTENNNYVFIGKDSYFLSPDGYLMPTRKDQPPPRLRGFAETPR